MNRLTIGVLLLWVLLWAGGVGNVGPRHEPARAWRAGDVLHCRGLDLNVVVCRREMR